MSWLVIIQTWIYYLLATTIIITFRYLSRHIYQGFVCGDPSISLNKKPDTITDVMLLFWGSSPILIVMSNFETLQ